MLYIKEKIIILLLILNVNIFANGINIEGKIVKLLYTGKRISYFHKNGEPIYIVNKDNNLITSGTIQSKGGFDFKSRINKKYIGEEFQFKTNNNDWFILFPFKGKFFLPKYSTKINIVMIPKNSQIYLELFKVVNHYTIQVFVTSSSRKADEIRKKLQSFCIRDTKKGRYYCNKYIKKIPIIEPNRDPLYKIYYNTYDSYSKADTDLLKIRQLKDFHGALIFQHTVIDTGF